MKNFKQHNDQLSDEDFMKSLPEIELPFSKSKEDVWSELSAAIKDEQKDPSNTITLKPENKVRKLSTVFMAVAAVLVVTLSTTAFFSLYTKTIEAQSGQHLTAFLPDGSSVELNASSAIKYKPYWWRFNRQVQFEGEAFFKVQKGESFEVNSAQGRTIVLGTSFNIYSRRNEYKVTCFTGKVRVVSVESGKSADILPNQEAEVKSDGNVISREDIDTSETISWQDGKFTFTGHPLALVFEEIERQYGINIKYKDDSNNLYTGNFTRDLPHEDVLNLVCRSFGMKYTKQNGVYIVNQ
ncbi:FecR family protein [Carboxylicivirga sp. N1Y90]|uniref:FecR family protein n=1 Tax=Carboxylicivirga fragile TaxID=3417571 RepID=UPI003D337FC0|nr:FecR family protein [Marinilabiliaceae bacterium N1Y90]